ncbi:MAG TPA: flagellar protein FlgN [Verrucomicrobiae bacterium]|jgi:flagellar biosynthesis/type III secretory pathway chaperone|nr:flagellar protein FlgN [Verrucomicrobiae bacterium]
MIASIQKLISALREELQNYGEMLALLDRQKTAIMHRASHEVFQSISVIKAQSEAIQNARALREDCRRAVAEDSAQPAEAPFAELIPALPSAYQPLVTALVDENNQLLASVRQRARQNHLLLSRSVELMQGVLNTLFPVRASSVYNVHGDLGIAAPPRGLCNAVG